MLGTCLGRVGDEPLVSCDDNVAGGGDSVYPATCDATRIPVVVVVRVVCSGGGGV